MNGSEFYASIAANIERFGLHNQCVFGDETQPQFTYTIGLHKKLGFELIAFSLNPEVAAQIFNQLSVSDGLELDVPNNDLFNLPVIFRRCNDKVWDYGVQAFRFYKSQDIPFVQMVFCDKNGKFPEDPDFDHAYMDQRQPLLYRGDA